MSEKNNSLLIVEDDAGLQSQMKWALSDYDVHVASERNEAMTIMRRIEPPVVVLDLGLPPDPNGASEGLATLEEILSFRPQTKVIVASGNEDRQNAVRAIGLGAYDFYPKPVDIEVLQLIIGRARHLYELEEENRRLLERDDDGPLSHIIAASPQMMKVFRIIEKVGPTDVSVLLTGESGVGKEVLAKALHALNARADKPFIAINCAAIPENLLESELFGHEKGAFTGAVKQTIGKVEQADGGTLFLDEIGEMPAELQSKMLRFLQEREFERIGGRRTIQVDVRIISATNADLQAHIGTGQFREDLYYRLNEVNIDIPPLRERTGDAVLLARHFLQKFNKQMKRSITGFTNDALAAISAYAWPGNVRELENRMKRAVVMADDKLITIEDLDIEGQTAADGFPTLKQVRERAESEAITKVLALTQNNVTQAAKLLGVSRPTLYDLMRQYNLKN